TRVQPTKYCASACFFLFLAGVGRSATPAEFMQPDRQRRLESLLGAGRFTAPGFVGLHRPYLRNPKLDGSKLAAMHGIRSYLERQMLSRRLVDLMMSRP